MLILSLIQPNLEEILQSRFMTKRYQGEQIISYIFTCFKLSSWVAFNQLMYCLVKDQIKLSIFTKLRKDSIFINNVYICYGTILLDFISWEYYPIQGWGFVKGESNQNRQIILLINFQKLQWKNYLFELLFRQCGLIWLSDWKNY